MLCSSTDLRHCVLHICMLTAAFLLCVKQQHHKECMLHIWHVQLSVRMWCYTEICIMHGIKQNVIFT